MLTGSTPLSRDRLKTGALLEMLRLIREEEPPPPSKCISTANTLVTLSEQRQTEPAKLAGLIRGDIDWIVMKALDKDRGRRYETANSLAADIERFLKDEPVEASPPAVGYRMRKFVRRNRGAVFAVSLVLFTLLAGIAGTTSGLVEARKERDAALWAESQMKAALGKAEHAEKQESEAHKLAKASEKIAKDEALRVRTALYSIQIDSAYRSWKADRVIDANRTLDQVEASYRDSWEYRYVRRLCQRKAIALAPRNSVECMAFSNDGRHLAAGLTKGEVTIWEANTGKVTQAWTNYGKIKCVAFIDDDRQLVIANWNWKPNQYALRILTIATGKEERVIPLPANVYSIAVSPDSQRIVAVLYDTVRIYDTHSGMQKAILEKGLKAPYFNVDYSPDGKWIVAGGSDPNVVKVWDANSHEMSFQVATKGGEPGSGCVRFRPDSKRFLIARDNRIMQVDMALKSTTFGGHAYPGSPVLDAFYSPNGQGIVHTIHRRVQSINGTNGLMDYEFLSNTHTVLKLAMSSQGKLALNDENEGLQVWSFPRTAEEELMLDATSVRAAAFGDDGKTIVTYADGNPLGKLSIWNASTGKMIRGVDAPGGLIGEFSPDGRYLVAHRVAKQYLSQGVLKVWEAATGKELHALRVDDRYDWCLAFSPDSARVATAGHDGEVRIWELATGKLLQRYTGHRSSPAVCAAFSPDGVHIVSGNAKEKMKLWNSHTAAEILTLPVKVQGHGDAAFTPKGLELVVYDGEFAWILDASSGKEKQRIANKNSGPVAVSGDGSRIFLGESLFDAVTGQELLPSLKHIGAKLRFSPDGKHILSQGYGTPRIFTAP